MMPINKSQLNTTRHIAIKLLSSTALFIGIILLPHISFALTIYSQNNNVFSYSSNIIIPGNNTNTNFWGATSSTIVTTPIPASSTIWLTLAQPNTATTSLTTFWSAGSQYFTIYDPTNIGVNCYTGTGVTTSTTIGSNTFTALQMIQNQAPACSGTGTIASGTKTVLEGFYGFGAAGNGNITLQRATSSFGDDIPWYVLADQPEYTQNLPSISIDFPTNGTTTAPFTNFQIRITNNDLSPQGSWIVILNSINSSSINMNSCNNPNATQSSQLINNTGLTIQYVTNNQVIYTQQSSTPWYACAMLLSAPSGGTVIASTSQINYFINNQSSTINNNFSQGIQNNIIATSSEQCVPPDSSGFWDITQWGPGISYGLCSVAEVYFGNATPGYQFMADQWTAFQNVPPFNLVFGIASTTENALANSSSSEQNLDLTLPIGTSNASIPILSSSTVWQMFVTNGNGSNIPACSQSCAIGIWNTIYGYMTKVVYGMTGVTTVVMIL